MLKNLSVRKAFALFGASSALVRSSSEEVNGATQNTAAAVSEFDDILQRLLELSGKSTTISSSLSVQNAAVSEIVRNNDVLFALSEESAHGAQETARQGTEVASAAQTLQAAVQAFKS